MKAFAWSAGRRAAGGLAAGAAVTAAQPSVQAREVVQQAPPVPQARKPVEDQDWLLTDLDQEVLVFKPFKPSEVDAAVEQVHAMMEARSRKAVGPSHAVVIEELERNDTTPASEAESSVSVGEEADAVLCQPFHASNKGQLTGAAAGSGSGEMHDFLKIASKLLKRPGLQTEVFKCMLEDREVRELMLKQSRNIDAYLEAVGVHNPRLLEGPEPGQEGEEGEGDEGRPVLQSILEAVAACIDKTGSWLAGMGGWLRDRFGSLGSLLMHAFGGAEQSSEGDKGQQEDNGPRERTAGDAVLGAVMVVTAAVFCVLLARSPGVLRTAAAGVTAAAIAQQQASKRSP